MARYEYKKWFIVQIKPNSYGLADRNLIRQGFETFIPEMNITTRKNNKFVDKKVFVFPGYIFVSFNPDSSKWNKINSTYGVSKIISFNKKPSEVSSDLILELKTRYGTKSNPTLKENLQIGDSIKFHSGPFANLIAEVESVDENNRICVLLESMGGYQRLKLKNLKHKHNKF